MTCLRIVVNTFHITLNGANRKYFKAVYTEVETGLVYVNSHMGGFEPHIPFGGLKASGNGFRLGNPKHAINAFSEVKTIKWNM